MLTLGAAGKMFVTPQIITFESRDNIRLRGTGVGVNWTAGSQSISAGMGPDLAKTGFSGGTERSGPKGAGAQACSDIT